MPKDHGEIYGGRLKPPLHICVEYNTAVYLKTKNKNNNPTGIGGFGDRAKGGGKT